MHVAITGSSAGIGRALTERLLAQGHHVWGIARSDQSDFARAHPRFRHSQANVAEWTELLATSKEVERAWPSLDALIACAGWQGEINPAMQSDPQRWTATVRANLDGTYYFLRAFYYLLQGRSAGSRAKVVAFSGGGATKPRPKFSAYGVAKTGVVRLIETLADELKDEAIDLNCIAPGAIRTRMTEEVLALGPSVVGIYEYNVAAKQTADDRQTLERALQLVEWLLSPASDGVSGRLIAAPWDPWPTLDRHRDALAKSEVYTLRRIVPQDRGLEFSP